MVLHLCGRVGRRLSLILNYQDLKTSFDKE